ncbi:tellurite resistance/C4-dicarboxylate transporter family protein [Aciditerrimonas ferrireducens]|uniref:Tellurite resistance/C4-dicarboxylate transporter family protein n=1 Tax=Aciditerrimonas ferrireducens TaxID=667306 RepID=A0ABV6BZI1_9ACTN
MSPLGASGGSPTGSSSEPAQGDGRRGEHQAVVSALTIPTGLLPRAIATLDPGYFAYVMATGIVSIGTRLLGYDLLSEVLLGFAGAGFAVLLVAYVLRLVLYPAFIRQDARNPSVSMAFFTLVAGSDVLGTRLVMADHPLIAFALACGAALLWLLLTYGLPSYMVAGAQRPVLREFSGTWLIWVVGTQSLAIISSALVPKAPSLWLRSELPVFAVCFWGLGVMLYVVLIVIILLRLLTIEVTPTEMGPAYWIAMGATAISVRAAAGILALRDQGAVVLVSVIRPFVTGISVVLWSFGTWWIPLLVLFGVWRHLIRRYPLQYEPRLWSMVFPLGMYTVASFSLGQVHGLEFMASVAKVWVWVGVAAWVAVGGLMLVALLQALLGRPQGNRAVVNRP